MKKSKYFNNKIPPACEYCEYGKDADNYEMVLCRLRGIVSPYYKCRRFRYSPIRRKPKNMPTLQKKEEKDFII